MPKRKREEEKEDAFSILDNSIPKKKVKKNPKKRNDQPTIVTQIDVGQTGYGELECPNCGMVYAQHHPTDCENHQKYCKDFKNKTFIGSIIFNPLGNDKICTNFGIDLEDDDQIVLVKDHNPHHFSVVENVIRTVNKEVGWSIPYESEKPKFENDSLKVFLYLSNLHKKTSKFEVRGCLIVESIDRGFQLITKDETSSSSIEYDTKPWIANMGVSRIWTHSSHRKKAISYKLLECARHNFIQDWDVPQNRIAFSQPTECGRAFGERYFERKDFLVYEPKLSSPIESPKLASPRFSLSPVSKKTEKPKRVIEKPKPVQKKKPKQATIQEMFKKQSNEKPK